MTELALDALIDAGRAPVELRLRTGQAALLDGPRAGVVVAALSGSDRGGHRVRVRGRDVTHRDVAGRARAGLVVVGDDPVAERVSVHDHLAAACSAREASRLLRSAPLLAGRGGDPAGVLSGGERRVLWFLVAEALRREVVVLDGAGAGLDTSVLAWAGQTVARWRKEGTAVVVRPSQPAERAWTR